MEEGAGKEAEGLPSISCLTSCVIAGSSWLPWGKREGSWVRVPAKRSRGIEMGHRQVLGLRTKGQGRRRGLGPGCIETQQAGTF